VMVAGIIVAAAADEVAASRPGAPARLATAALILGGPALYLAGHAAFKAVVWKVTSVPRLAAVAVLALLGLLAPHVTVLALAACAAAVVLAVCVADRRPPGTPDDAAGTDESP
jgi:low temperature requirement protein LtrA